MKHEPFLMSMETHNILYYENISFRRSSLGIFFMIYNSIKVKLGPCR